MSDQYETRYCAYVDILGFRTLIKALRAHPEQFTKIRELLKHIHTPLVAGFVDLAAIDFQAQSISDAVAISTRSTPEGLLVLFDTLERLSFDLLQEGYFTRGAICKGGLYHDQQTVFGEALVSAFGLESEVVRYPRIMLTKAVVEDARSSHLSAYFSDHIKQADDGPFFVHVLQYFYALRARSDTSSNAMDLSPFRIIGEQIQRRFDESVDYPRHFEKVQWFGRYWNRSFSIAALSPIVGPGLDEAGKWC
jgi:hypothetical protein